VLKGVAFSNRLRGGVRHRIRDTAQCSAINSESDQESRRGDAGAADVLQAQRGGHEAGHEHADFASAHEGGEEQAETLSKVGLRQVSIREE
jgi:hypothetical protein